MKKKCLECSETKEYVKIFVNFLKGIHTLDIFKNIFLKYRIFFSGSSCFKNIYIYTCKFCFDKIAMSVNSLGGNKTLADADAKNASFFTCSLRLCIITNGILYMSVDL